jgi:predicted secreted protein
MSQKLTEQELQDFKAFRQEASRLAAILGELHYQRTLIDLELENVKAGVKANAAAQQKLLKELGEKYGDGSINVETGEIAPLKS